MICIDTLLDRLRQGHVPFGFEIDGNKAQLEFSHDRPKRRQDGKHDFVYSVTDAPLNVVLETDHRKHHDYLTFRYRIQARESLDKRISNVRILDLSGLDATSLRGWEGGNAPARDEQGKKFRTLPVPPLLFKMWDKDLTPEPIEYIDLDGRSSCELLPVWLLYNNDGGLWIGPEWSGSWQMAAGRNDQGAWLRFSLPCLDFTMLQGEEVQLPPVSMGIFRGQIGDGCVKLRRIIREDFLPTIDGEKPLPPVSAHAIGGSIPDLDAEGIKRAADMFAAMGMEQFVFASAWYRPPEGSKTPFALEELQEMHPGTETVERYENLAWWEQCGLFEPDPKRFPEGINEFARRLAKRGIVLGLWYDPRLNVFTEAQTQWQDALTPYHCVAPNDKAWNLPLIDMGSQAGRECMFELLERMVVEFGAKHLWHDLNTSPRPRFWQETEQEGRKGLMELRHYMGSDQVYDRFLKEYPGVWIKWCGSGGTMLNLGVFRRVHSFRLADFGGVRDAETTDYDAPRDMRTGLNWILPTTYLTNLLSLPKIDRDEERDFIFLNLFGSTFTLHHTCRHWSDRDRAAATRAIGVYKNVRHYLRDGDFWSLLPQPQGHQGWDAWQFHDPVTSSGLLVFFKRRDCKDDTCSIRPRWPENWRDLRFAPLLGQARATIGPDGLEIDMPDRAALLRYEMPATEAGPKVNADNF
jgi:hypothetical protein